MRKQAPALILLALEAINFIPFAKPVNLDASKVRVKLMGLNARPSHLPAGEGASPAAGRLASGALVVASARGRGWSNGRGRKAHPSMKLGRSGSLAAKRCYRRELVRCKGAAPTENPALFHIKHLRGALAVAPAPSGGRPGWGLAVGPPHLESHPHQPAPCAIQPATINPNAGPVHHGN